MIMLSHDGIWSLLVEAGKGTENSSIFSGGPTETNNKINKAGIKTCMFYKKVPSLMEQLHPESPRLLGLLSTWRQRQCICY